MIPAHWTCIAVAEDGFAWTTEYGLRVIESIARELDGRLWHHLSVSRADRIPSYHDVNDVKDVFIGRAHIAYQVFPPRARHVNIHSYCLHLWSPLEGDEPLPDFRQGSQSI
jgi:hypothetical protein